MIKVATFKEDKHEHIIFKYPNGKYYIHLNYDSNYGIGTIVAGGYIKYKESVDMLYKFRPFAKLLVKHFGTFAE